MLFLSPMLQKTRSTISTPWIMSLSTPLTHVYLGADTHQSHNHQQGRLLLLSADWRLWSPPGPILNAAARLVLSARHSEHITPLLRDLHWLRMPERIWLCSDVPPTQWHSSVLPGWQHLPGSWRRGPPSTALISHQNSTRLARQTINLGQPFIPCCRFTGVEQSTVSCTNCTVTHHLPTRTENISLPLELCRLLVTNALFHILLTM